MKYSVKMYGGPFDIEGARPIPTLGPRPIYSSYSNKYGYFETTDINIAYQYRVVVMNHLNNPSITVEVMEAE